MNRTEETKGSAVSVFAVILVFLISGAAGYFTVSLLPDNASDQKKELSVEEPEIIVDPQIRVTIKEKPQAGSDKLYSFVLGCSYSEENKVEYELIDPRDSMVVKTSKSGMFSGIEPIEGGFYYVRVIIRDLGLTSRYFKISGVESATVVETINPLKNVRISILSVANTQKDNVFNMTVTSNAENGSEGSLLYWIYSSPDGEQMDKTSYSSNNGRFSNIAVKSGLKYYVALELSQETNVFLSDFAPVADLKWKKPEQPKVSKQEVENLINKKESLLGNKHFSSATKITITNPNEVSQSWTTLHNFIQQKFYWNSVSVDSLIYNQDNSVKTVIITVDYNE